MPSTAPSETPAPAAIRRCRRRAVTSDRQLLRLLLALRPCAAVLLLALLERGSTPPGGRGAGRHRRSAAPTSRLGIGELLYAVVFGIRDVDVARCVGGNPWRQAKLPAERGAHLSSDLAGVACRGDADLEPRAGVARAGGGDVLPPGPLEVARGVELPDPVVEAVGNVDVSRLVDGHPEGLIELTGRGTRCARLAGVDAPDADLGSGAGAARPGGRDVLAPGALEGAIGGELLNPVVQIVGDVDISEAVGADPSDAGEFAARTPTEVARLAGIP